LVDDVEAKPHGTPRDGRRNLSTFMEKALAGA
jgi:hypothetical protein